MSDQPYEISVFAELSVESSETVVTCPSTVMELSRTDGTPFDSSIFSFNQQLEILSIQTNDPSHVDTYSLRLTAYIEGYTNLSTFDFQVEILISCELVTLDMSPMLGTDFD